MNTFGKIHYISFISIIQFFIVCNSIDTRVTCLGSFGKCDGTFKTDTGIVEPISSSPNSTISVDKLESCKLQCRYTPWCIIARFSRSLSKCYLYDKTFQPKTKIVPDMISTWNCCNVPPLCKSNPIGKCRGYWTEYEYLTFIQERYSPLLYLKHHTEDYCLETCVMNIWCTAVNYNYSSKTCILQANWYMGKTKWNKSEHISTYLWKCCHGKVVQKEIKTCYFRKSVNVCKGYWTLSKQEKVWPNDSDKIIVGEFHTLLPSACIRACDAKSNCTAPLYNQISGRCILISNSDLVLQKFASSKPTYQTWIWNCCNPITYQPISIKSGECVCVQNNTQVKLYRYMCNSSMTEVSKKYIWPNISFHKISQKSENILLVSDGYRIFWLKTLSANAFKVCPDHNCELNNGAVKKIPPTIVTRSEWFADENTKKSKRKLKLPVKLVIIWDEYKYTCDTYDECIFIMYAVQMFYIHMKEKTDLPYNFMIGNDGKVYEGRGWGFVHAHTDDYNDQSISIAFIGSYNQIQQQPSIEAITAVKELLQYGLERHYLTSNYVVMGQKDIDFKENPGLLLYELIQSWPHYSNESDQPPIQCESNIIFIYMIGGVLIVIMLIALSFLLIRKRLRSHKPICSDLSNIFRDRIFSLIPLSNIDFKSIEINADMKITQLDSIQLQISNFDYLYLACDKLHQNCLFVKTFTHLLNDTFVTKKLDRIDCLTSPQCYSNCSRLSTLILLGSSINYYDLKSLIVFHCSMEHIQNVITQLNVISTDSKINVCQCRRFKPNGDILIWTNLSLDQSIEPLYQTDVTSENCIDLLIKKQKALEKINNRGRVIFYN